MAPKIFLLKVLKTFMKIRNFGLLISKHNLRYIFLIYCIYSVLELFGLFLITFAHFLHHRILKHNAGISDLNRYCNFFPSDEVQFSHIYISYITEMVRDLQLKDMIRIPSGNPYRYGFCYAFNWQRTYGTDREGTHCSFIKGNFST